MLIVPSEKEACELVKYHSKEWKRIIKDIDLEDIEGTKKALTEAIREYNQLQRLKPYGRSLCLTEAGSIEQSKLDSLIEFSREAYYKITLSGKGLPTKNIEDLTIDEAKEYYEAIKKEREDIKKIIKELTKVGAPIEMRKQDIYLVKERCALALRVIGELSGGKIPADMLNEYQKILNNPGKSKPNSNANFTGYWKPDEGFKNIPKFNDKRAELLQWIKKCDAADGYPLFRLYQEEGRKYPNHTVLISCYGGEPIKPESWWLRDVPRYVLDRLEREVNGYNWLISYIVEGVEEKTGNPNGNYDNTHNNPNHAEAIVQGYARAVKKHPKYSSITMKELYEELKPISLADFKEVMGVFIPSRNLRGFVFDVGTIIHSEVEKFGVPLSGKVYYYMRFNEDTPNPPLERDIEILTKELKTKEREHNPNHNEDTLWQQREATQERILDRLKLKESDVKIDEPPLLVTVGTTHTVVGEVDGLKLNFALGEIAQEDVSLFDTFRIHDRVWHVKKSIVLSTLKGRQKARDKREGKQMKMYEEWGGLTKFEKKEEYKPTTVIEKLADDAIHKRGWWQDKL